MHVGVIVAVTVALMTEPRVHTRVTVQFSEGIEVPSFFQRNEFVFVPKRFSCLIDAVLSAVEITGDD